MIPPKIDIINAIEWLSGFIVECDEEEDEHNINVIRSILEAHIDSVSCLSLYKEIVPQKEWAIEVVEKLAWNQCVDHIDNNFILIKRYDQ